MPGFFERGSEQSNGSGMGRFKVVARGGPIREANQDSAQLIHAKPTRAFFIVACQHPSSSINMCHDFLVDNTC